MRKHLSHMLLNAFFSENWPANVLKELIAFFNTFQALPREKSSNLLANCKVILMITDNDVDYFKIVEEKARNWLYNLQWS